MSLPRQHAGFDERRNTSRVFPVPPTALPDARRALAAFKRDAPELYQWIADGHPRLSEAEHVARFGGPYGGVKAKRERRAELVQVACDRCTQGVMDATNPHLLGTCSCPCHAPAADAAERASNAGSVDGAMELAE